jgi:RimJ/RimL family protein N-acetyltransferase
VLELQLLRHDHRDALLAFEVENRAYFARSIVDRGDEFYATFAQRHDALLAEQAAGVSAFYVLVDDETGAVVGRFNLYDIAQGSADVGYRVAERVAGRGVATQALRGLCHRAAHEHGLSRLTAGASRVNVASQRVLTKAGFVAEGPSVAGGERGIKFAKALRPSREAPSLHIEVASSASPEVAGLLDALTAELAAAGYSASETFGYSAEQLQARAVHLVGARLDGRLVGLGGLEVQDDATGELKRFFVVPEWRGAGVADALIAALVDHARDHDINRLRLETGDEQHAAMAFYRRHGFAVVPRFGPYVDSAISVCMERALP